MQFQKITKTKIIATTKNRIKDFNHISSYKQGEGSDLTRFSDLMVLGIWMSYVLVPKLRR